MVPSFVTRKVASGRTLGERLQETRQNQCHMSLAEIAQHIRVPEKYLTWLENDEYDQKTLSETTEAEDDENWKKHHIHNIHTFLPF